jgi:membrane associated rhomboid family serine protease
MKRSETLLLLLIAFFIVWIFASISYPLVGLIVLSVVFAALLGFIFLMLLSLRFSKSK